MVKVVLPDVKIGDVKLDATSGKVVVQTPKQLRGTGITAVVSLLLLGFLSYNKGGKSGIGVLLALFHNTLDSRPPPQESTGA